MNGMDYQRNSGSFCSQATDEAGFAAVSVDDVGTKVFELTNQVTVGKKIPEWMNRADERWNQMEKALDILDARLE